MTQVVRTTLACPRCGHRFPAIVEQILDVGRDPQVKSRFLSGRVNMVACPNCGHTLGVGTPLLYHDPNKDLLIIHIPMELNISPAERENIIGDLTRRLTNGIPPEKRRAYLLQPKQALTLPGMIDMILDADGITREMREAQREKVRVMEMFLQVSPENWPQVAQEQAAHLDSEFLDMLLTLAENASATGREDMAEGLTVLYSFLLENTPAGQEVLSTLRKREETVREVADRLQKIGSKLTRQDFMAMVLEYADDADRLQALVGLMRPAFDYTFFQELSGRIESASGQERERLTHLRDHLLELTRAIDQQTQTVLQRAADTLRVIVNSEDIDAAIRPRLELIDDTFLAVLQANIQAAEDAGDEKTKERLELVLDRVLEALREAAPPPLRLINDVLSAESEDEARRLIQEQAAGFGPEFLSIMDAIALDLEQAGRREQAEQLRRLRDLAVQAVNGARPKV